MRVRAITFALIIVLGGISGWQAYKVAVLETTMGELKNSVATLNVSIAKLASTASTTAAQNAANIQELQNRKQIVTKSQDQMLREAVAAVTPAVVSIVETKEVPLLKVTYQNPFGNDPYFQGFGVQVPVYQQVGTTTQKVSAGTGFIFRSNGYILTNKHVVPDIKATYTVLLPDGKQKEGIVVWRSTTNDIAVVKIQGSGYATVPFGDSGTLSLGQSVFAVGNALGEYNNSVSTGVISGLNRSITASGSDGMSETLKGVIQTDAAINPGNSGGPLVTLDGKAVGLNVATVSGSSNISFSIPIEQVQQVLGNIGI